jgi:hypothetical protein
MICIEFEEVGPVGFEPTTKGLSGHFWAMEATEDRPICPLTSPLSPAGESF